MRVAVLAIVALLTTACQPGVERVTLCDLANDPAKYNHREIEISGFVSHAFEDFTLFEPRCESPELMVWLEYGGLYGSGTTYCCNDPSQTRRAPLEVEGIRTTLLQDGEFRRFDSIIQRHPDTLIRATLRGRYFSGEKEKLPGGTVWRGYGHFGMASLLVIEKVVKVASQDLPNIDYRAWYDHPGYRGEGCFTFSLHVPSHREAVIQQQQADGGNAPWRFDSPKEVMLKELQPQIETPELNLVPTKVSEARVVFDGTAAGRRNRYFAVVSRPYWLTHDAADPRHVIWVLTAAYEYGCPEEPRR